MHPVTLWLVLSILNRKQTQIKHKQVDLCGSSKRGTSTETADCILLEEWYKHSTQPGTILETQCFTLTLGVSLKSALFHSHTLPLHTPLSALSMSPFIGEMEAFAATNKYQLLTTTINIVVEKERVVDGGEGGWEKCWQFANVDNLLQNHLRLSNYANLVNYF